MKKLILILNLLLSLNFFPKNYVYDMHFPEQDPPWYFNANSITDDKKGNLCIGSEKELFFLNQQGKVEKVVPWKTGGLPVFSVSIDEEGNTYGLTYINYFYLIKIDPKGNLIKWGPSYVGDFMYSEGFIYGFYANYTTGFTSAAIWDKDFSLIKTFGEFGSYIWVNSNRIFCSHRTEKKIKIYSLDGEFLKEFSTDPYDIRGICTDYEGNIYGITTSPGPYKVIKYSQEGQYLGGFGDTSTEFWNSIDNGEIYYLNEKFYFIYKGGIILTDKEGNIVEIWSSSGKEEGRFSNPQKIEVSRDEKIYVADKGNNRIQVFNNKGELKKIIGAVEPDTISTDKEGNLFVGSRRLKMIFKFDKDGNFIKSWLLSSPYYEANDITDIAVDRDGYVYALDGYKNCIAIFENSGEFVKEIHLLYGSGHYLEIDNEKNIILAFSNKIYFYNQEGIKVKELIIDNDSSHEFIDIDLSEDGKIFLLDPFPVNRVLVIDYDGKILDMFCDDLDLKKGTNYGRSLSIAENGSVYILDLWRVLRYKPRAGLAWTIPASASTKGANGTYWRTDLSIFNPSEQSIDLKLNYFSIFGNKEIDLSLGAYEIKIFKDIVSNTFGMPETFGAITSICFQETQPILFSRTYTEAVAGSAVGAELAQPDLKGTYGKFVGAELAQPDLKGTYGQGIRAFPYEETFYQGEKAYLIGLKNNENFRTNIGFFNLKEFPVEIKLKLHNEEGEEIASSEYNLDGFGHLQINNIFSSLNITKEYNASYAVLWTDTQDGRFACYGSIVDNFTGDPVYIEGEGYGTYLPEEFIEIIPVVASKEGANNTNWKTEAVLTNVGIEEQEVELVYHISGQEGIVGGELAQPVIITLKPGEVRYFKDILTEFFSYPESFGWLKIRHSTSGLKVRARIYTESVVGSSELGIREKPFSVTVNRDAFVGAEFIQPDFVGAELAQPDLKGTYGKFVGAELAQPDLKGTYGQGVKALNISKFSNSEGYLIDLEENENFRTNFGLLPLSVSVFRDVFVGAEFIQPDIEGIQMPLDQNKSLVKFKLDLIKDGQAVDEKEIEAEEGNLVQINNFLSTLFKKTGSGYLLKINPEEGVIFTSYISKVDNHTGDAIFQPVY